MACSKILPRDVGIICPPELDILKQNPPQYPVANLTCLELELYGKAMFLGSALAPAGGIHLGIMFLFEQPILSCYNIKVGKISQRCLFKQTKKEK